LTYYEETSWDLATDEQRQATLDFEREHAEREAALLAAYRRGELTAQEYIDLAERS
jgi:hypothetical protein